ncbi:MAG: 5-(carboxyamino)imidazole ribonucleotide mutase [Myxococcota bacterium]|nr:5-(carboxyamino)imidazole ribonucleotide mutase [Myxococcota bacterium]
MGSKSDLAIMSQAAETLEQLKIPYEIRIISAHRRLETTKEWATTARERGLKVLIAGAGLAAHLPGVLAAATTLPVLGVPLPGSTVGALDSLYSIVQMPKGIPVGTLAIGKAGAINAALLAAEILGTSDDEIAERVAQFRVKSREQVAADDEALQDALQARQDGEGLGDALKRASLIK